MPFLFTVTTARYCLIPFYFSQLDYLLWCGNNLCNGVSAACSEALTNRFYIGAVLFPAAESVWKHVLEAKPPGQQSSYDAHL